VIGDDNVGCGGEEDEVGGEAMRERERQVITIIL
jgi:hypothetical protein